MGRGRAKAKQTKVARELKYFSPDTDYNALERELHGQQYKDPTPSASASDENDDVDEDTDGPGYNDYDSWRRPDR